MTLDMAAWRETVARCGGSVAEDAEAAVTSRRSIRAFLPEPVPRAVIERIIAGAARAPSGTNMQPWQVTVATGAALDRVNEAVSAAYLAGGVPPDQEYRYYPPEFPEPYLARRRACGWGLYGRLGIAKGDHAAMRAQHARNYRFFDAPAGLVISMDRRLERGSWIDVGMFVQNLTVMARHFGLHSCTQAAYAPFHHLLRRELGIPEGEVVICGLALGFADWSKPENGLVTERAPLDEFVRWA
jgi:nitroreductase